MAKIADPWDHHDWDSKDYVLEWAARQDEREAERREVFELIARTLPYARDAAITILDLGAGYGALCRFLLAYFPNAGAVCQDGSEEMIKLGRKRIARLDRRMKYVLCDFSKPRMTPSLQSQKTWLKEAGFEEVQCFWDGGRRAMIGGFRR